MNKRLLTGLTSLLASLMLLGSICFLQPVTAQAYTNPVSYSAEKREVVKWCYNFLVSEMELTPAGACGVLANIDAESDFDPDCVYGKYYGLFQLGDDRLESMKAFCQSNGFPIDSVEGQMRYIAQEHLNSTYENQKYQEFLDGFAEAGNTAQGAYDAARYWASKVERCSSDPNGAEPLRRAGYARDHFWPIYGQDLIDLKDCEIDLEATVFTYQGSPICPKVTVEAPERTLKEGTDYTLTYSSNETLGTGHITIASKGSHVTGSQEVTFQIQMAASSVRGLSNRASDIQISWDKIPGAKGYRIYRKIAGTTSWSGTQLISASAGSFTTDSNGYLYYDTTAQAGVRYCYTVRAYGTADGKTVNSNYDNVGKEFTRLTVPALSAPSVTANGLTIKWTSVAGADSYKVYRKSSKDSKLREVAAPEASPSANMTWSDTNVESGVTYTYTVRAYAPGCNSEFDRKGASSLFVGTPGLTAISNTDTGLKITWESVPGAEKYRIYRRVKGSSSWSKLLDQSASKTYYNDTKAAGGTSYEYTVRACIGSTFGSYVTKGISGTHLTVPALTKISNNNVGIAVSWGKVTGAEKYYIYRYEGNSGKWAVIHTADGSKTSWSDTTAVPGTYYTYTVRAMSGASGANIRSDYVRAGISMVRVTPTAIQELTTTPGAVKLTWKTCSEASGYLVQYSYDKDFTSPVGINVKGGTSSERSISGLTKGKTVYVRVRTYTTLDGKNYYSYWSPAQSIRVRLL